MALVGAWYLVIPLLPLGNHIVYAGTFLLVVFLMGWFQRSRRKAIDSSYRLQHLQQIHLLTHAVGRSETIETVYDEALNALERSVKADRASVLLLDASGCMRFKAWKGRPTASVRR